MDLLHVLRLVVIALAGLLLYCLVLAALVSFVIRGVQRNRPVVAAPEREPQERRGDRWSAVPGWVARDRRAVAVVLLGAPDLAERTGPYGGFAARHIDWLGLRLARPRRRGNRTPALATRRCHRRPVRPTAGTSRPPRERCPVRSSTSQPAVTGKRSAQRLADPTCPCPRPSAQGWSGAGRA